MFCICRAGQLRSALPVPAPLLRACATSSLIAAPTDRIPGFAALPLGHRRLAIIDLSAAGTNRCDRGRTDLAHLQRRDLQLRGAASRARSQGHRFRSHTDSEVILYAYGNTAWAAVTAARDVRLRDLGRTAAAAVSARDRAPSRNRCTTLATPTGLPLRRSPRRSSLIRRSRRPPIVDPCRVPDVP